MSTVFLCHVATFSEHHGRSHWVQVHCFDVNVSEQKSSKLISVSCILLSFFIFLSTGELTKSCVLSRTVLSLTSIEDADTPCQNLASFSISRTFYTCMLMFFNLKPNALGIQGFHPTTCTHTVRTKH